jgi:hypothetical protein
VGVGTRCWDLHLSRATLATMNSVQIIDPMLYPPLSDGDGRKIILCFAHSAQVSRSRPRQEKGEFDWIY